MGKEHSGYTRSVLYFFVELKPRQTEKLAGGTSQGNSDGN